MALFMLGFVSCYALMASLYIMMISNRNNGFRRPSPAKWER